MPNLLVSLMDKLGVPVERLGKSEGRLQRAASDGSPIPLGMSSTTFAVFAYRGDFSETDPVADFPSTDSGAATP